MAHPGINAQIFTNIKKSLREGNVSSFLASCDQITPFIGSKAAYYAAAKPELVEMLEAGIERLKFWSAMTIPPPTFDEMQYRFNAFALTLQAFMKEFKDSPDLEARINQCFDWLRSRTSFVPSTLPLALSPQITNAPSSQSTGVNSPMTQSKVPGANGIPKPSPPSWDSMKPGQGLKTHQAHMFAAPFVRSSALGSSGPPGDLARSVNQPHVLASGPALSIAPAIRPSTISAPTRFQNRDSPAPVLPLKRSFSAMLSWEDWAALDDGDGDAMSRLNAKTQTPPLTVFSPSFPNAIATSSPQSHINIFGSPSTSTLGNTSPGFMPGPQRRSSSTLRQDSESVGSVVKVNDVRTPAPAHVSVKLEGDVSQADATKLSLVAERPGSGSCNPVNQIHQLSHTPVPHSTNMFSVLSSPAGAPLASIPWLPSNVPKKSSPQRITPPPTPDSMTVPISATDAMASRTMTSEGGLESTTLLGDSGKENDGTNTVSRHSPTTASVDAQGTERTKLRISQPTESALEETNTEARRRSSDPSASHLPPTEHIYANPTKTLLDTSFGGTALPPVAESEATSHLASPLPSDRDVAACQTSTSPRHPPPSVEIKDAPDHGLRVQSLPLDDSYLAFQHGINVKNGHPQSHSQKTSVESKQGLTESDTQDTPTVKHACHSDMSLSEESTKREGWVEARPRLNGDAMEIDEHSPSPRASRSLPPAPLVELPALQINIGEIQPVDKPEPTHLELKPLRYDNTIGSQTAKPSSLSPLTFASSPVFPPVVSARDPPAQQSELTPASSSACSYSQTGVHQPPFTQENALRLELNPESREVVPPKIQSADGPSGPPVDTSFSDERSMSISDDGAPDPNDLKLTSTTTSASDPSTSTLDEAVNALRGRHGVSMPPTDTSDPPGTTPNAEQSVKSMVMASPKVHGENSKGEPFSGKIIRSDSASSESTGHENYVKELRKIFVPLIVRLHALSNPGHNPDVVAAGVTDDDLVALANMGPSVIAELKASNLIDPTTGLLNASASSLIRRGLASTTTSDIPLINAASPGGSEKDIEAALTTKQNTPDRGTPPHAKRAGGTVEDMDVDASSHDVPLPPPLRENVPGCDSVVISDEAQLPASNEAVASGDNTNSAANILTSDAAVASPTSISSMILQSRSLHLNTPPSIPLDIFTSSSGSIRSHQNIVSPLTTFIVGLGEKKSEPVSSVSAMPMLAFPPQPARQLCFIRGQSGLSTTETKFDLSGDDMAGIDRWMGRQVNFDPKGRHLCVHLHCFNAKAFEAVGACEDVAALDDQWPSSGDFLFAVYKADSSPDRNPLYMPLAPPLLNTRTSPVCFSPLARLGVNSLRIVQVVDCSELVFVLRLEQPIHEMEKLAKLAHDEALARSQWNAHAATPMVFPPQAI